MYGFFDISGGKITIRLLSFDRPGGFVVIRLRANRIIITKRLATMVLSTRADSIIA